MYRIACLLSPLLLLGITLKAQPDNVLISTSFSPNEPSICINPNNLSEIVAGTNLANVYTSSDSGKTWQTSRMTSSFGVWGDPVIACDTSGDFYFFHLSNPSFGTWIDRIVCQKSTDGGKTWNDGSAVGKDSIKAQDKEWAVVDPRNNTIYMTWTQFDEYGKRDDSLYSNILFSKSTNGGNTWSSPLQINEISGDCIDSSLTTEGAVPTVGPNGEVYVSWAGPAGLVFDKSLDGGNTWLSSDILIDSMKAGWTYSIPGINRCNGLPVTVCDISASKHRGTIYVNWSDQRNGLGDTDVWLSKSTDGGNTWSSAKRVNDDSTNRHQFLTWMTVDQSTGFLYFIWYDRRNYDGDTTEVFMAVSYDGGETFVNGLLGADIFVPSESTFFGDYTNISAVQGHVRPIWTIMNNGQTEIWTALYTEQNTGISNPQNKAWAVEVYPNPFQASVSIKFNLEKTSKVSLALYDMEGRKIEDIVKKKSYKAGQNIIEFKASEYDLKSGTYIYELNSGDQSVRKRIIFQD